MSEVLGYITQNYTLFLVGAIIVILAVIGYYAEKTNFGQPRIDKDKKNSNSNGTLDNVGLIDVFNKVETDLQQNSIEDIRVNNEKLEENNITKQTVNNNVVDNVATNIQDDSINNSETVVVLDEKPQETINPIIDAIHKELNLVSNEVIFNVEEIKQKESKNKKREEAFNKFSDEFDAILPEREIISDDLLSEIDDLELGKTQKFNLKDFKRFDNIKLPRISDTVTDDQDIWKI